MREGEQGERRRGSRVLYVCILHERTLYSMYASILLHSLYNELLDPSPYAVVNRVTCSAHEDWPCTSSH